LQHAIRLGGLTAEAVKVVSRERKEKVAPAVGFEPTIRLGGLTAEAVKGGSRERKEKWLQR